MSIANGGGFTLLVYGLHTEQDDVGNVIAHVADRAAAHVDKWYQASTALALQRRVIPADTLRGLLLGIALIELKAVLRSDFLANSFSNVWTIEHCSIPTSASLPSKLRGPGSELASAASARFRGWHGPGSEAVAARLVSG